MRSKGINENKNYFNSISKGVKASNPESEPEEEEEESNSEEEEEDVSSGNE